jgi:hypothetical protein
VLSRDKEAQATVARGGLVADAPKNYTFACAGVPFDDDKRLANSWRDYMLRKYFINDRLPYIKFG